LLRHTFVGQSPEYQSLNRRRRIGRRFAGHGSLDRTLEEIGSLQQKVHDFGAYLPPARPQLVEHRLNVVGEPCRNLVAHRRCHPLDRVYRPKDGVEGGLVPRFLF
jgi:hypothetical protein